MDFSPINLHDLAQTSGEWLRGSGPESDIVISSRIRLARNLADFPFIARATDADRAEIGKILRGRIEKLHDAGKFTGQLIYVDVSQLEAVDRQFLVRVGEYEGIPIYVSDTAREPYSDFWVPRCGPGGMFELYVEVGALP